MTTQTIIKYLNKQVSVKLEQGTFTVPFQVLDVRKVYNRIDLLVQPINGQGQAWISADRAKLEEKQ